MTPSHSLEDRFAGALLGTMVGDQLGASFEGQPPEIVAELLAPDIESAAQAIRRCSYTDDTQMMIGVAESLVERRGFDAEHMAQRFAANYEPHRGYGAGTHQVLAALRAGHPWHDVATLVFPDGSFGNGAAMRVAPVGVLLHHDLNELRHVAEGSAAITHAHPLGIEGAALQAGAVALAARSDPGRFDAPAFLEQLQGFLRPDADEYLRRLRSISQLLATSSTIDEVAKQLGTDIRAHGSVPAAIYAFLAHHESFSAAVIHAVRLGGDTDTIGAMTGAIAGALHGARAIPSEWVDGLENTEKGKNYVRGLARRLYALHVETADA
jgi:poly(ADP-ribose) glycohydrolase ARH3